ncbi:MAG: prepilin-type N-terminal cleavage/methylation domain-containing protein [Nitrospiria bacterium]
MKLKRIQMSEKGFTLIELLIALSILAFGLLMAANFQTTAITGNKGSSEMNVGTLLGQEALEQLLIYNASVDPSLTNGSHTAATEVGSHPNLIPNQSVNGIAFTRNYTVSTNTPIVGIRTIVMNVQWTDKSNHQVSLVERTIP